MCGWSRGQCGYCGLGCICHSGFQEDLADGVCKEECNTALCAFDAGDCVLLTQSTCAPGCFKEMVGDGTCQSECLSEACGNDSGDCDSLLCAARCYPHMIDNGQCEDVCHVEECLWDGSDCDCSPGCTSALLANDQCDSVCASCNFDNGRCECFPGCTEAMRGDGTCNPECFNAACENDNGDCECAPGCLYADIGQCKLECQVPECNYDLTDSSDMFCQSSAPLSLDCSTVECFDMWGMEIANCDFSCEQCSFAIQYKVNCCAGCCSENYFPHPRSPHVCVRSPDLTSEQRPRVIYVGADSVSTPTLSIAFASLFEKYVEVHLLPGAHILASSKYFIGYSQFWFGDADHTAQVEALKSMKITSQSCVVSPGACDRAVVLLSGTETRPFFLFSGNRYLEVRNVEFISDLPQHLCAASGRLDCTSFIKLFDIRHGMTARFENVTFSNFSDSMTSVITVTNASLILNNVNFIGIMLHADRPEIGIIALEDSNVTYTNGSISLTNNLWDFGTLTMSAGALNAIRGELTIDRVSFTHNFMANAGKDSQLASLIKLRDCRRVTIVNCEFAFNVGRKGAVLSIYTFMWGLMSRNFETTMATLDSSVVVSNCTFRNNTGSVGSSIYVHYLGGQQNILITNCTFVNELAEVNSVIAGYSRLPTTEIERKFRETVSGATTEYPVPRFIVSHSHFRNCDVGLFGLIALMNLWNVRIEDITVEEVGEVRSVTSNSLQVLMTVPNARIPKFAPFSSPKQCQALFNFTSSALLHIEYLSANRSNCMSIMTTSGLNITISKSYFGENKGTAPSGYVITSESRSLTLREVVIEGNTNNNLYCKGTVYLTGSEVNISSSRFALNTANKGAALYLDNVLNAEIRECIFEHNSADMGGAVFIEGSGSITLNTFSSVFRNNSAAGYGGSLCIAAKSRQLSARISHIGAVFERCRSTTGSAIYISEGVILLSGTQCKDCKFSDNVALQYGACVFESVSGELAFTSSQFARNIGKYSSSLHATFSQSTHLALTDMSFDGNEAASTVIIAAAEVVGLAVTCRNNSGTCLSFESANFTCAHCHFGFNSAVSGAALQFHSANAACEDCQFQSNSAEFTGGAVLVKSYSLFACRRCGFENNTSQWQGGGVFVEQQSSIFLDTVDFTRNTALGGGFALFLVLSASLSVVRSSHFTLNQGTNYGCISLISASLTLQNCEMTENFSADLMGGLMLSQSVATIESCRFTKQTGVSGVFVSAVSSNVTISNSRLADGAAVNTGAAMALVSSQVNASHCVFEALSSGFGGAISAQDKSNLSLQNCSFRHVFSKTANRGVFTVIRSALSLSNSSISFYDKGSVYGLQASITVANSSFTNGTGSLGGGVACTQCKLVAIHGCSFVGLAADRGAGVFLEGSGDSFRITDSEFRSCRGTLSGAVYIEEYPGSIKDCLFLNNSGHRGGAVHIAKSSTTINITGNRFESNSAVNRGGALCWEGAQPTLENNQFIDNRAVYGTDVSSYAVKIAMPRSTDLVNITSGRPIDQPLVLELLDIYGQIVADDNDSIAQLTSENNNTIVSGEVRVQAKSGQFFFTDSSILSRPGSNTSIKITTSAIEHENSITIPVLMRYCAKGEYLASSQCIPCAPGTYSLTNDSNCANCHANAICFGNFTISPKPGFWRSSANSHEFFECPNSEACLGSMDGTSLTGVCASGYEGAKCQACMHGHYQWGAIYCSKCWGAATRTGVHVFVTVLLITALGALVGFVLLSYSKLVLYIKIFVHYVQVVMLFKSSGIAWPRKFLELFNAYEVFGAFPEYVLSGNCMIENYYEKLFSVGLVQPALILLAFMIWGFAACFTASRRYLLDEFVSTAVAISFLATPSVLRTMLESFRCEEVEPGEYWLLQYNLRCWTSQHTRLALGVALPCIILYGFAVPALILRLLRREQSESVRFRYVTLGYSKKRRFWEFVILYWKLLVIGCLTLFSRLSSVFPALSVFGVMVVTVGVLAARRRREKSEFNSLETQSLAVCAATLYIGLVLSTGVLDGAASMVPFGVVLSLNVYFVSVFTLRTCVVIYRQIKKRIHPANEGHNESA